MHLEPDENYKIISRATVPQLIHSARSCINLDPYFGVETSGGKLSNQLGWKNIPVLISWDIEKLYRNFCNAFFPNLTRIEFFVSREAECPKFHVDNYHVRAIVQYLGPTVEIAENEHVNRDKLGNQAQDIDNANALIVKDLSKLVRPDIQDITILAGSKMTLNPVVHKSPEMDIGDIRVSCIMTMLE